MPFTKLVWVYDSQLSNISSLLVEIKSSERKGSKLPVCHTEDSALGEKPTWTVRNSAIDLVLKLGLLFASDFLNHVWEN